MPLKSADLPALHDAASQASLRAQRTYLRLVRVDLGAMVGGAALSAIAFQRPVTVQWAAVLGAVLLTAGLIITAVISRNSYEQRWYGGRAIAESVKTIAWRYAAGAEPFPLSAPPREIDTLFTNQLRAVLDQSEYLSVDLGGVAGTREQISPAMRALRIASLEDRKSAYLNDRINDQRAWYSAKAARSASAESKLFGLIAGIQALGVLSALILIAKPGTLLALPGIFTTIAASLLAWLQVKRHQELAQSYGVAAHELGLIAEQVHHIATDAEFAVFVADAEAAISREHTLWVARRDVPGVRRTL